jgi:hypothetical protein
MVLSFKLGTSVARYLNLKRTHRRKYGQETSGAVARFALNMA